MALKYFLLMLLLILTLINDILTHKIQDRLILPFLLGGFLINGYLLGWPGVADSLLASLLPLLFLGIFLKLKLLGAGELKLYSAIGAVMGAEFIIKCLVFSTLTGGLMALIVMQLHHSTVDRLGYFLNYLKHSYYTRSLQPFNKYASDCSQAKFPSAYAIAGGAMMALLIM